MAILNSGVALNGAIERGDGTLSAALGAGRLGQSRNLIGKRAKHGLGTLKTLRRLRVKTLRARNGIGCGIEKRGKTRRIGARCRRGGGTSAGSGTAGTCGGGIQLCRSLA